MDNDLSVDFEGFIGMLKSLLQDCVNNPVIYQSTFTMENDDGCAFFRFFHNSEYRKSQILQLAFKQIEDEEITEQVSYRINSTERKAEMIAERVRDINEIIRKAVEVAGKEQGLEFDANVLLM
uniref:Spindle assembly abnormal protein 6 N-terminal domain-containing protein n=1 Tax=Favella ehrenbergii TaxID=182087 RepID=A0A7S3HZN2_9SPIT|mmetsp:Transcript_17186/g.23184  ORF Transcript_17186/g.23184 Transcript_17186/m.23184 type:complete len:123 (+) Transcript_17186:398-766(+)|eukprot:CAMPEP_0170462818 /NCGR_PEP_ID=MMETSP0123-20130129/8172_1 /TAXON_ID=182087 /ORGANISM="Favella ehrenbergii, Strain Fehren 1" /LENGTH=122 /DNA_ID=CAMNT_0010728115 /DNA_START=398 /DNA_END=766 /DNA_ORIENTATION=+